MKFIRGLKNLKIKNCVATIGNFDGLHLGHQKIIESIVKKAKQLNLPSVLITFEPLPQEFFLKDKTAGRLLRLRDKLALLESFGIDYVLCLRFNKAFANLTANDFIKNILVEKLGIKHLIVGDDFRFGRGRTGDFALLQKFGQQSGFVVEDTQTILLNEQRIGSSRVRIALANGDLLLAEQLLGRKYAMSGHVAHGEKLGRQLGVPTLNLPMQGKKPPFTGIFVVQVYGLDELPLPGVASLGIRPTINGKQYLLEVHLFDFNNEVYGHYVQVEFLQKIRDEEKFNSLDELKIQMQKDIELAKEFFKGLI